MGPFLRHSVGRVLSLHLKNASEGLPSTVPRSIVLYCIHWLNKLTEWVSNSSCWMMETISGQVNSHRRLIQQRSARCYINVGFYVAADVGWCCGVPDLESSPLLSYRWFCVQPTASVNQQLGIESSWHLTINSVDNNVAKDDDNQKQCTEHQMFKKTSVNSAQLTRLH